MVTFDNLFREGYDQYDIRLDGNVASVQARGHSGGSIRNMTYHVLGSDAKKEESAANATLNFRDLVLGFDLLQANNNKKKKKKKKKEDDMASLGYDGYDGFTLYDYANGGLTSKKNYSNKKEDKMALTFWDSLKLISPEVGEQFETEQEYRDAVLSAGAFLHASDSLDKLGAVYGSGEAFVCDFDGFDDEKNTEENN